MENIPDRIWLNIKSNGKIDPTWDSTWKGVHDIEYVRKDVIIEKALEYIRKEIRPYYSDVKYKYDDFKKYIED